MLHTLYTETLGETFTFPFETFLAAENKGLGWFINHRYVVNFINHLNEKKVICDTAKSLLGSIQFPDYVMNGL